MRLSMTSFTETEELEDDSVGSAGEDPHAVLQLLIAPVERVVHWPQVLDAGHIQEIVLGETRTERLEFIWNHGQEAGTS